MRANELQDLLSNWTVKNSGLDRRRPYLGLSGIGDCPRVIYLRYVNGSPARIDQHFLTRISYELEAALIERLRACRLYSPGETIELHDGLVQGHTDGVIARRDLLEIKTVPREIDFPRERLPRRVFWQVQAYLRYTGRDYGHVIYLARDNGAVLTIGVRRHADIGLEIEKKIARLVEAVCNRQEPACECGRCAVEVSNENSELV